MIPLIVEFINVAATERVERIEALIRRHAQALGVQASFRHGSTDPAQPPTLSLSGERLAMEKLTACSEPELGELLRLRIARSAGLRTVLFVCTGNAVRSQIAQGIVNHFFGDKWAAFSAGTMPLGVQEDTVAVMREIGIDMSGQFAKNVDLFKDCAFSQVVILCSDAGRRCPIFPYAGRTDHMAFDDPLSPDILAGAIVFSYRAQLRSLRKQMQKAICSYLERLEPEDAPRRPYDRNRVVSRGSALLTQIAGFFARERQHRPTPPADRRIAAKYRSFKCLLGHNRAALEQMARLEQLYLDGKPFSLAAVRVVYTSLLESLYGIVHALESMTGGELPLLIATLERIDDALVEQFSPQSCLLKSGRLVLPFADILPEMSNIVGSKAANLAIIGNNLGLPVPEGFAITAHACERFLEQNGLATAIDETLSQFVPDVTDGNERRSAKLQNLIRAGTIPPDLGDEIVAAFDRMEAKVGSGLRVAMRSSAVGEDTDPTFAGQYETVLNVTRQGLFAAYKEVLASKYAPPAIHYRMQYGLDDRETPMCVAAVAMVEAQSSGVIYSRDPGQPTAPLLKLSSLWGLGEQLVDGSATPDVFLVERESREIRERIIPHKHWRLVSRHDGGTELGEIPAGEQAMSSLDDAAVKTLADYCLRLEGFFARPQDVEWARDMGGNIFLLQSRPLFLPQFSPDEKTRRDYPAHPVVLAQGTMASPGVATGSIFVALKDEDLKAVPKDAILVVRTASPRYARVVGAIRGLIAEVGSVSSHMASVAREFGLPMIVDARDATRILRNGEHVTLAASSVTVYRGRVAELLSEMKPSRERIMDSPVHQRMRAILDRIVPLGLIDAHAANFSPAGCRTFHDIIRYAHETAVREMFRIGEEPTRSGRAAVRLSSRLPLSLYLVDLGGGLKSASHSGVWPVVGDIECRPLRALWRGFTHPGVNWEGTMNAGAGKLAGLLAGPAMAELGEQPGGDSYAIVSGDYLNFNAKFAYHFATIDALCGDDSAQNYISLQFSGGAGSYAGRSLRSQLMANILQRLDFEVSPTGDLLTATFARYSGGETAQRLDLLGRLLASVKLLDMSLSSQEDIAIYSEKFLAGDYDFLATDPHGALPSLYIQGGDWNRVVDQGHACCVQDGSRFGASVRTRIAGTLAKLIDSNAAGAADNVMTGSHFALAIVRGDRHAEGAASVRIRLLPGKMSCAGGLAFAIRDRDNYLVLSIDARENKVVLAEFRDGKPCLLDLVERRVDPGVWQVLRVEVHGTRIKGFLNGDRAIFVDTGTALDGFVGLWSAADSTAWFDEVMIAQDGVERIVEC